MKATTEFLNTQIDKGPGSETRILEIEQSDKHNWKELREVLLKARKDGFSYKIVEGCLVYVAYRTDSFDLDEALSKAEFPWHKKSVLTVGSLCRHIEGTRVKPLTLFPIETSLILDILFCRIKFMIILDHFSLAEELRKRGLKAKFGKPSHAIVRSLRKLGPEYLENIDYKIQIRSTGNIPFFIDDQPLLRLIYECLSVDAVAQDSLSSIEKMEKLMKEK
jgi:hypothetical protein